MPSDKSLETMAREWLDEQAQRGAITLHSPHDAGQSLVTLLHSRGEQVMAGRCHCKYEGEHGREKFIHICQLHAERELRVAAGHDERAVRIVKRFTTPGPQRDLIVGRQEADDD